MGNPRARYTLEFKLEAVRMVKGGQSLAAVAKILDIRPQTLHNWIKAEQQGRLGGAGSPAVSAEQMEIARLKAELARRADASRNAFNAGLTLGGVRVGRVPAKSASRSF